MKQRQYESHDYLKRQYVDVLTAAGGAPLLHSPKLAGYNPDATKKRLI